MRTAISKKFFHPLTSTYIFRGPGEFILNNFKKELNKATKGYECFIVMTVKWFLHQVNELLIRIGIVFGNLFLEFIRIYRDFTRFIIKEISEKIMDEKIELEMIIDD